MNMKTGTREWSEHSFNCVKGCSHSCLYCYGRDSRFNAKRGTDWAIEELAYPKVKKWPGVVMFPTQHDFTPGKTMWHCLEHLAVLMEKGNHVLVVTKAGLDTVDEIVRVLGDFPREQSELRFTLTNYSVDLGKLWEPGAPTVIDRLAGLHYASDKVRTSVSCEPWLDTIYALLALVAAASPSVTETIWIGHANKIRQRTRWTLGGLHDVDGDVLADAIAAVEARQTPAVARQVYDALKSNPKVRWKESYRTMLGLDGPADSTK